MGYADGCRSGPGCVRRGELVQRLANTGMKAFGLHANLWERDRAPLRAQFTHSYVSSVSATIAAGTSEVQRNIIATRGLGLPRG